MRALKPLVRLLQRSLRAALVRRGIAWMACVVILIALGGVLGRPFGNARMIWWSLLMTALSALPVFLLWPPSERLLRNRFRRLDAETVFEAYLEAEPGQARELLRQLAAERASALAFLPPPREPLLAGLGGLIAGAVACLVLVETGSFLIMGRLFPLGPEPTPASGGGVRIEEQGFSDFATEDPAARQARRERILNQEDRAGHRGENASLGSDRESAGRAASSRRAVNTEADPSAAGNPSPQEVIAKRKQGELEGDGSVSGSNPAASPKGATSEGSRTVSAPGGEQKPGGLSQGGKADQPGASPAPGRTGQGYEHTADTKVPSPLLDYRSRLEARYAERTGMRVSASGRMSFGDLREFQRRYFDSFTLRADVGATEDPYAALLKKRWAELKGGTW